MRTIFITLFLINLQISFAQDLKFKRVKSKPYTEEYTIDKKTKQKSGNYKLIQKYRDTSVIQITGQYKDNNKIGIWKYNYFNDFLVYDHSKDSIMAVPSKISKCDSFFVKIDNKFILSKVDFPPIFFGYWDQLYDLIETKYETIFIDNLLDNYFIFDI